MASASPEKVYDLLIIGGGPAGQWESWFWLSELNNKIHFPPSQVALGTEEQR